MKQQHAALFVVTDSNHAGPDHTPVACGDRTIYVRAEMVETEHEGDTGEGKDVLDLAWDKRREHEHMSNTTPFDVDLDAAESESEAEPVVEKGKKGKKH